MRIVRAISLAVVLAMPLAAQQPEPRLKVTLANGGTFLGFTASEPAYVAVFDVTTGSVEQIYPYLSAPARTTYGTVQTLAGGAARYREASLGQAGYLGGHRFVLVASTQPLRIESQWITPELLGHALERAGYSGTMNAAPAIDALIDLVAPADPAAEVVTDEITDISSSGAPYVVASNCGVLYTPTGGDPWENFGGPGIAGRTAVNGYNLNGGMCSIPGIQVALGPHHYVDTTKAAGTPANAAGIVAPAVKATPAAKRVGEPRVMTDPDQIRSFMSGVTGNAATHPAQPSDPPRIGRNAVKPVSLPTPNPAVNVRAADPVHVRPSAPSKPAAPVSRTSIKP